MTRDAYSLPPVPDEVENEETCPTCMGSGRDAGDPCPTCGGTGTIHTTTVYQEQS